MRIPQIQTIVTEYQPLPENLFNPIIHSCIEDTREKFDNECRCGSTDEDDYYPNNKSKCKYCVRQRAKDVRMGGGKCRHRGYATCDCGVTGESNFYHSIYRGKKKIQYPCKQCRKKYYQ